jgi:hypothetical protein
MTKNLIDLFDFHPVNILPLVKKQEHEIFKQSDRLIIHDKKYGYVIGYLNRYFPLHIPNGADENGNIFVSDGSFFLNQVTAWAPMPKKGPEIKISQKISLKEDPEIDEKENFQEEKD